MVRRWTKRSRNSLLTRSIVNLPSIAVVTPSFNQAPYLEAAIRSVLDQGYTPLEYVVMDGGSTDGSVEILERYNSQLAFWSSGKDDGQYDAVGKGLAKTKGEIMGWLNSDDAYLPGSLSMVGEIFAQFPEIEWLTTLYPVHWDDQGRPVRADFVRGFNRDGFFAGEYLPAPGELSFGYIQQESAFWRRSLWERAGGQIDPTFRLAGDFALWAQFYKHAELVGVAAPLGGFRLHRDSRISWAEEAYRAEAVRVLEHYGGHRPALWRKPLREIGRRAPVAVHRFLASTGTVRRARAVRWDIYGGGWRLEESFI